VICIRCGADSGFHR